MRRMFSQNIHTPKSYVNPCPPSGIRGALAAKNPSPLRAGCCKLPISDSEDVRR
jgi:hypothetical protein